MLSSGMKLIPSLYADAGNMHFEVRPTSKGEWEWEVTDSNKEQLGGGIDATVREAQLHAERVAGEKPSVWATLGPCGIEKTEK